MSESEHNSSTSDLEFNPDEEIDLGGMEMDMGDVLGEYFSSEEGVTIGESLWAIKNSLEVHNKIMIKLLNAVNKKN